MGSQNVKALGNKKIWFRPISGLIPSLSSKCVVQTALSELVASTPQSTDAAALRYRNHSNGCRRARSHACFWNVDLPGGAVRAGRFDRRVG
jgi:hypothetical protein